MKVEVYRDITCPWCRLGMYRFDRALAEFGGGVEVELVHHPYQLDPDAPEQARPVVDAMAEVFGAERWATMAAKMTELGANEGVEFRFDRAIWVSTFTAHRLLWFAARDYDATAQDALAKALLDAYFRDGGNVGDHAELTVLAERAGLDGARVKAFLASDEGVAEVREQLAAARRDGIASVPTFIFDNGERLTGASETDRILAALRRAAG